MLYDVYNNTKDLSDEIIISRVILQIEHYIRMIRPSGVIFIAFDGVAPFAKMDQQRSRRYKSWFADNTPKQIHSSMFTPGTQFMAKLASHITLHFGGAESKYGVSKIITSTSEVAGEGEHKIFQYIRDFPSSDVNAIYGLDSDLIMLSLFHCTMCANIYVFREAPEFKSVCNVDKPSEVLFMDIGALSSRILLEMNCAVYSATRVYDYIFICFFLGNDFLPHFPALNIRTSGIQILLDTYRQCIGKYDRMLIVDLEINWKNVAIFIGELAKNEHSHLLGEYAVRSKWDGKYWPETTPAEKDLAFQSVPVIYRSDEKYIYPAEPHWKPRYYKTLLPGVEINDVCVNYLEGLEWVFKYYTKSCPHWRWKYNHHYPPLLSDLHPYVPHFKTDFMDGFLKKTPNNTPVSPVVQLMYVLPRPYLHLLPADTVVNLDDYPESLDNRHFKWAFCRYFWESHVILPEISISL